MFFANDSLIFCRAKPIDCLKLADTLKIYEQASGQMINLEKSSIVFNNNTSTLDKATVMNILDIHRLLEKERYLGLPLMFGKSKRTEFKAIRERLLAQTQG